MASLKISEYIADRKSYAIDKTYQRPSGAWSKKDKQCLIDTIFRKDPMPMFFFNQQGGKFYVVDGQQRLEAITDFYDGKLTMSKEFSDPKYDNKKFEDLSPDDRKKFLGYTLNVHAMNNYDDEKVRSIFSRLQRGKPLNLGERLNAKPGALIVTVRNIFQNNFFGLVAEKLRSGYKLYPTISRMLFYETYGIKDCSPDKLYQFFDEKRDLNSDTEQYSKVVKVLNYLYETFKDDQNINVFTSDSWVIAIYQMISDLMKKYSLIGLKEQVCNFLTEFYRSVYIKITRQSDPELNDFFDHIRGGWSESNMSLRRDTLIKYFLEGNIVEELDPKRQIDDIEKQNIWATDPHCQKCKRSIPKYNEGEYHHQIRWADGGQTNADNIVLLCSACHKEIHSIRTVPLTNGIEVPEDDIEE